MDIAIICYGSRGDVQPFAALARGLRHIGHHVRLVAPSNFASLAEEHGVAFVPVGIDLQAHLAERITSLPQSGNLVRTLRALRDELSDLLDDIGRDTTLGAEVVVGTGPASASVAEKLAIPFVEAVLQPLTPTRAFPSPVVPTWLGLGGAANWLTHVAFELIFWQLFRGNTNRLRTRTLGLPPHSLAGPLRELRERGLLRLYAYSSSTLHSVFLAFNAVKRKNKPCLKARGPERASNQAATTLR